MKNWFYQILRRSQKYTGTDNVYLIGGGFWLILGQFAALLAGFLLTIVFANLLSPTTYGNYKYVISLFGMLEIFSLAGMGTAMEQAVARNLEGSFYTLFKTKLKWASLGSVAALGGAVYYWLQGNAIFSAPLLISAVFLPLMNASGIYINFLTGKKLFNIQTRYRIITQIIFAAVIITALFLTQNIFWLVAAYLMAHTFSNYFFYLLTKHKFQPNKQEDGQTLNYGKHLSVMGIISQAAMYLDKILLFNFLGPAQLAIYSFATLLPEQIQNILGNITTLAMPKLAPKPPEEIRIGMMKKFWKLFLFTGVIIILYIIIAPYFYKIFFPQYLGSIFYSQIFMISSISIPAGFLGIVFQAKMMKKELYLIKIAPFINIILLPILIPFYGVFGAIMALLGAQIFKVGLILFLFRKF